MKKVKIAPFHMEVKKFKNKYNNEKVEELINVRFKDDKANNYTGLIPPFKANIELYKRLQNQKEIEIEFEDMNFDTNPRIGKELINGHVFYRMRQPLLEEIGFKMRRAINWAELEDLVKSFEE